MLAPRELMMDCSDDEPEEVELTPTWATTEPVARDTVTRDEGRDRAFETAEMTSDWNLVCSWADMVVRDKVGQRAWNRTDHVSDSVAAGGGGGGERGREGGGEGEGSSPSAETELTCGQRAACCAEQQIKHTGTVPLCVCNLPDWPGPCRPRGGCLTGTKQNPGPPGR